MTDQRKKQILVPTDFSEVGDCAIAHGIEFAKIFHNDLTILHVIDSTTKKIFKEKELEDASIKKLKEISREIKENHNIQVNIIALEGNIFETINEIAEKIKATLVIMGTHGKKGIQKIIGSYALKVISASKVPFVVVQKKTPTQNGYKNIVLPMDISKEAKQKVLWAIYLGKLFKAKIHILIANEKDPLLARKVKNNLVFTKKLFEKNSIDFDISLADKSSSGLDANAIKFSQEISAGLIIVMTTKLYGLDDYIVGPAEQKIITNKEEIPVMCVNPREDLMVEGGIK